MLSNGTIFNDLEWPLTWISSSRGSYWCPRRKLLCAQLTCDLSVTSKRCSHIATDFTNFTVQMSRPTKAFEFNQSPQPVIADVIGCNSSLISPYFFVYFWISEKVKWFSPIKIYLVHAKSTGELISFEFSDRSVWSLVSAKRSANPNKKLHFLADLWSQSEFQTQRKTNPNS